MAVAAVANMMIGRAFRFMAGLAVSHFGVVNFGALPGRVTVAVTAVANKMVSRTF